MIYIDFECLAPPRRQQNPALATPLLLGALWPDHTITQFIVDPRLAEAARADRGLCRVATLRDAATELIARARTLACPIVSWSTFDSSIVHAHAGLSRAELDIFSSLYVNALQPARRWASLTTLRLPDDDGQGNALSRYCAASGYDVPGRVARVRPARNLRYLLAHLRKAGARYRDVKPKAKARWHDVLEYNRHDLLGLRHVHERVTRDLAVFDWYARGVIAAAVDGRLVRWAVGAGPRPRFIRALDAAAAERYVVLVADPFLLPDVEECRAWLDGVVASLADEGIRAWPAVFLGGPDGTEARPALLLLEVKRRAGRALARQLGLRMFIRGHREGPALATWCGNAQPTDKPSPPVSAGRLA